MVNFHCNWGVTLKCNEVVNYCEISNYKGDEEKLNKIMEDHCIPENFYKMEYDEFLKERRKLMAKAVRSAFQTL